MKTNVLFYRKISKWHRVTRKLLKEEIEKYIEANIFMYNLSTKTNNTSKFMVCDTVLIS